MPRRRAESAASSHEIDAAIRDFESKARSLQMQLAAGGYCQDEANGIWDEQWQRALVDYKSRLNPK